MNPQNQQNSLRTLYETGSNVFDLGDYETFQTKMKRPESRQKFYSALSQHYDLGDYKTFEGKVLGLLPSESPQQQYDDTWAGTGKRTLQGAVSGAAAIPRGLNIGMAALGKPIAEISEALGMEGEVARNERAYKYWAEKGKEVDKYLQGKLKDRFGEILPSSPEEQGLEGLKPFEDPLGTANRLAKIFVENAPTTAMLGIATAVNPPFGTALLFSAEAGSTEQAFDELEASGVEIPTSYRMAAGVTVGALNAALERVGFGEMFKAAKVPGLKAKLLRLLIASPTEGGTEGLQEINQILAEAGGKMTEDDLSSIRKIFEKLSQEIFANRKRIEQATLAGTVVGTGVSTIVPTDTRTAEAISEQLYGKKYKELDKEQKKKVRDELKKVEDYQGQLDDFSQLFYNKPFSSFEVNEQDYIVEAFDRYKSRYGQKPKVKPQEPTQETKPQEQPAPEEPAIPKDLQEQIEKVSQEVYGKKFSEISPDEQLAISDELIKARKAAQEKKFKEAIKKAVEPEKETGKKKETQPQIEGIAQAVYGKAFSELSEDQQNRITSEFDKELKSAEDKKLKEAIRKAVTPEEPAEEAKAEAASTPAEEAPEAKEPEKSKITSEAIQKMASPAEVDNATLQRVTELEDAGLSLEGDETLNLLDNRSRELYASQKPIAEQQKEVPVKVEPEKPQPILETKKDATAAQVPIADINKDVDRFQNRATDFSEKTAATIAERYDPNLFDPIVIWKDEKDGKTYVLSGHSRLEGMRRRGEKSIPARYFQGTEQDAVRFSRLEANRLGTAENLSETLKAFRQAKNDKLSKSRLKDLFDGDVDFLESVINLSEKGDFINILGQPANSEFPYIKRFARWVGELRKTYSDKLTDRHEQQIFDWLYKSKKRNVDIGKDAFFDKIEKQVSRIDFSPEQPLVLTRSETVATGTRGRSDTKNLEAELDKLKQDRKKARTAAEVQEIDKDISRIQKSISEIVKSQADIFSEQEEVTEQSKIEQKVAQAPTAKDFTNAVTVFEKAIAGKKTIEDQMAAAIAALQKENVSQVIIDELTEPRRSPRPFSEEGDFRELTTRKGRIERAVEPPANVKPRVDTIAESVVDFRNKEADFEQAKKEIIDEIKARGGEVVVDTESGAFTIKLQPGRAKMGLQDSLALQKLRREAAEAGAYSLATVGRGFEIAAAPETIKAGEALQGTFADKAKEFIRRHQAYKAAGKVFDKAKADAHDELVNSYLAERAAGREPQAFKGMSKAGVAVEVLTRRNRSAIEPDVAAKGRDFPREVEELKKKAKERGPKGEPFLETRKAGVAKTEQAKKSGTYVAERGAAYTPGLPKADDLAPIFYSQLERVLETKLPNSGTPESFLQVIEAFQKKGEFKQEEINWIGLKEWLAEQKGKLTKQQVLDFVKENQVEIKEISAAKFDQYQIPGGENYRELLLTLPSRGASGYTFSEFLKSKGLNFSDLSREEISRLQKEHNRQPDFLSGHFDEPNILAHVRFNERTDADGKRVLFLEEVQSDWHQEGRKRGYKNVLSKSDREKLDVLVDKSSEHGLDSLTEEEFKELQGLTEKQTYESPTGVPNAPFKTTWHELVMKRMLRYAADNGFDRIAWTTGEQQADRYDLSKQVSSIDYTRKDDRTILDIYTHDGQHINKNAKNDSELSDIVGKEIAQKISNNEGQKKKQKNIVQGTLSALDLKVGGEGMKGFYDKILPQFMDKYGKKWGAKTGETYLAPTEDTKLLANDNAEKAAAIGAAPVHSIDITPAMRESVRKGGQVLFEKQEPYNAKYSKRKDASLKTNILASQAVNAISNNRRRGRVLLANAINAEAREKGAVSLIGKEVRTSDDVAALAQVYRDPRWETLRYIFVKNGKVVHVTGVSNRLPASSAAFPFADTKKGITWLQDLMTSTKADGYYMVHNHPSGDATPSDGDYQVTNKIASQVSGYKGHVIINSNHYVTLIPWYYQGNKSYVYSERVERDFGKDKLLTPTIKHPILGTKILSAEKLAEAGKSLETKKGWITLIASSKVGVRGIMEVTEAQIENQKKSPALLRRFARQSGAPNVLAYVSDDFFHRNKKLIDSAIRDGFVLDVVSESGFSARDLGFEPTGAEFGIREFVGREVREPSQAIPDKITVDGKERSTRNSKGQLIHPTKEGIENFWKWFGDSKVVDEQGRPLVVYHGTNAKFDTFDKKKIGSVTDDGFLGKGFYFSTDPNVARSKSISMSIYLRANNPVVEKLSKWEDDKRELFSGKATPKNDSAILDYSPVGYNHKEIMVKEPTQIKSATGNIGTFSPTESSIVREEQAPYSALLEQVSPKENQLAQEDEAARKIEKCR